MSDTNWTPGPWYVTFNHRKASWSLESLVIAEIPGDETAYIYSDRPAGESVESIIADANLIAAAPELYEALNLMRETFADGEAVADHSFALAMSTAEEALDKARGEPNE